MKLTTSEVKYIPQKYGYEALYEHIEKCARVCYKSEAKCDGTFEGAKKFVDRLIKSGHTAMLEHSTIYLKNIIDYSNPDYISFQAKYDCNPYSSNNSSNEEWLITTNFRVLVENGWLDDLKYLCNPTKNHEKRYTFRFITSIGIVRELLRHRKFSFANESTRYCNYNKDKFDNQIIFIEPHWLADGREFKNSEAYDSAYEVFCSACEESEGYYNMLIDEGFNPQDARELLPLCTKSELVMTGFASDWKHLLDLRYYEKTGKVHPDMKVLMEKLKQCAEENNIWKDISYESRDNN